MFSKLSTKKNFHPQCRKKYLIMIHLSLTLFTIVIKSFKKLIKYTFYI